MPDESYGVVRPHGPDTPIRWNCAIRGIPIWSCNLDWLLQTNSPVVESRKKEGTVGFGRIGICVQLS